MHEQRATAAAGDLPGDRLSPSGVGIDHRHGRAGAGEGVRRRPSDAGRAAADQCDLLRQRSAACCTWRRSTTLRRQVIRRHQPAPFLPLQA